MHVLAIALASLASLASAQNLVWITTTPSVCVGTNGPTVQGAPLAVDDFCATFVPPPINSNGFLNHTITGWCVTVPDAQINTNGAKASLANCTSAPGQTFFERSDGKIGITTTAKCLVVTAAGALETQGCGALPAGSVHARLRAEKRPKSILIRHKDFNHKCAGGVTRPKKVLGINQRCSIFQVDKQDRLRNVATGFCADVFGRKINVTGSASTIGIYNCHDGLHQKWTLGRVSKKIKVATTGNCLDVDWLTNKLSLVPCADAKLQWHKSVGPVGPPPRRFSPYTDVNMFNLDIGQAIKSKGLKYINFAFVLSNAGVPSWGGIYDILPGQGNPIINQKVIDARSNGAEVIASFGGALGSELALANLTVSQLQSAYRVMIDFYGIRTFDFDIEGTTLNNVNATDRRLTAIKGLSSIYSDLEFIWTLPVETTGFLQNGLDFIQQSINAGIPPKLINLMTLDFGTPQPSMSNAVIVAATSARLQLLDLGLNVNLGITPMIGVNDVGGTFTLGDADIVLEFARTTSWASFLSFWSINRDNGNNNSLPESSKIEQTFLEFTTKFATFTDA